MTSLQLQTEIDNYPLTSHHVPTRKAPIISLIFANVTILCLTQNTFTLPFFRIIALEECVTFSQTRNKHLHPTSTTTLVAGTEQCCSLSERSFGKPQCGLLAGDLVWLPLAHNPETICRKSSVIIQECTLANASLFSCELKIHPEN